MVQTDALLQVGATGREPARRSPAASPRTARAPVPGYVLAGAVAALVGRVARNPHDLGRDPIKQLACGGPRRDAAGTAPTPPACRRWRWRTAPGARTPPARRCRSSQPASSVVRVAAPGARAMRRASAVRSIAVGVPLQAGRRSPNRYLTWRTAYAACAAGTKSSAVAPQIGAHDRECGQIEHVRAPPAPDQFPCCHNAQDTNRYRANRPPGGRGSGSDRPPHRAVHELVVGLGGFARLRPPDRGGARTGTRGRWRRRRRSAAAPGSGSRPSPPPGGRAGRCGTAPASSRCPGTRVNASTRSRSTRADARARWRTPAPGSSLAAWQGSTSPLGATTIAVRPQPPMHGFGRSS